MWTEAIAGLCAIAAYFYKQIVPSDQQHLGNLNHAQKSTIYKEDYWPEHGYADLPAGLTHYYLLGPKDGKKVVFVHGISSPPPTVAGFLDKLARDGHRVLCYGNQFLIRIIWSWI